MARTAARGRARKVAIVTGGGTGLGRDCANTLARDGYEVAIIGRRADRLKPKRGEKNLHPYPADVGNPDDVKRVVKEIKRDLGRIDALVNAAAIFRITPIPSIKPEDVEEFLRINVGGTVNMTLACLPELKKARGSVVNFSSTIATRPSRDVLCYAITKGGIDAFTRALSFEVAPHVRVNCVTPGLVRSEVYYQAGLDEKAFDDLMKYAGALYPMGRAGEPEDVSEVVAFLVSDKAQWLTGVNVPVDGGWLASGAANVPQRNRGKAGRGKHGE